MIETVVPDPILDYQVTETFCGDDAILYVYYMTILLNCMEDILIVTF